MQCNFTMDPTEVFLPQLHGLIDGTLNAFTYKAQTEAVVDYSVPKYGYSLSTLVVCDNMCCIMYYVASWPCSANDKRVFCNSNMFQNPTTDFTHQKYLLGDSSYE